MNKTSEERILAFIRDINGGKEPSPLRTCLTREEALGLVKDSKIGRNVFQDMDIRGYGGKLCNALISVVVRGLDPQTWPFWIEARTSFLEHGGCYLKGKEPAKA